MRRRAGETVEVVVTHLQRERELLGSLPWDTPHPETTHLKQLVRRVRRRLLGTNVAVQSQFGLGYRLVPNPAAAATEPGCASQTSM